MDGVSKFLKQVDRPFVEAHICSLNPSQIDEQLFGSEKPTSQDAFSPGFIELANHGTLYIDDIDTLKPDIQNKLFSTLKKGTFNRIHGQKPVKSSFRLISSTQRDLDKQVQQGDFNEELYLQIAAFPVHVPSLRDRKEDIPDIIRAILPKLCQNNRTYVRYQDLPKDFVQSLINNPPRGNIYGIEHLISRLLVFSQRDTKRKPVFDNWRSISFFDTSVSFSKKNGVITLKELMERPLDVCKPDFPSFSAFMDFMGNKMVLDAKQRFKKNTDIAKALQISDGAVSLRLKRLRAKQGNHFLNGSYYENETR